MSRKAKVTVKRQYALLLNHDVVKHRSGFKVIFPFIQFLEISEGKNKEGKPIKELMVYALDKELVKKFPKALTNDLGHFFEDNFIQLTSHHAHSGFLKKVQDLESYAIEHAAKHTKLIVDRLTEEPEVQWYHKILLEKNKTRTQRIEFVRKYAALELEMLNSEDGFGIEYALMTLEGEKIPAAELTLSFGFLRRDNIYYLLTIKDMNVLYLIRSLNIEQHKNNLPAFTKYVLAPIEKTHKIKCKELEHIEVEEVTPKLQLHLTELAGSFLVITPKFDYGLAVFESEFKEIQELFIDGTFHKIKRHKEVEQEFRAYLKSLHPRFQNQFMGSHNVSFEDAKKGNWFFKVYHEWLDKDIEIIGMDLMKNFKYSPHPIETKLLPIRTLGNLITFDCIVFFGKEQVKLADVRKVVIAGGRSIYLKDNSIGILTDAWNDEYALLFKHGKIVQNEITVPKWIGITGEQQEQQKITKFSISHDWWSRWKSWQNHNEFVLELPKTIRAELRPYQRKGFEWMVLLNEINAGACLADDMGLGKTLQTITFMAHQAEQNEAAKMLVVCPASLLYNWKNEIEKFAPNFKTLVHYGPQRDFKVFLKGDYDVLICSYHTARMDEQQLSSLIWDVLVLDESHNIRSMKAQMTQAVHRIRAHSNVILSGTPMVNNTFDLFAQFEVILPGLFGGQDFFNSTYATPIDKHKSTHAIQNLNKLTKPFILRRTKKQVATDLPEKIESIIYCEMNPDQREAYETVKAEVGKSVFLGIEENGLEKSKLSILQAISKLRMLCCLPKLLDSGAFDATSSVKLDMLLEEIERNLGNHKVLVFSQYLGMLDAISNELTTRNIAHFRFDGSTPAQKRMLMVDAFQQEDSQERIFLVSLKAGNTGITLTEADYVFLVDPWWNEAIQRQAIDRTHRIGQKKTVFAYKMICKDSLEERMLALQQRKQFISDELIVEDENIVKNLTLEDISFLFG